MTIYLLRLGELTLKGGNRREFEQVLKRNLAARLRGTRAKVNTTAGRFYVSCDDGKENDVENILDHLLGISGWAKTRKTGKTAEEVFQACIEEARALVEKGIRTFKIEARRTDKSFPLESYGIRRDAGEAVLNAVPEMKVDVQHPQAVIHVEIRERAFIYSMPQKGHRGLPVGTAGRGLLLLSGGIDSPVAGYMMATRGMHIEAVYFHAYPYTSDEARQKVVDLASLIGQYAMGVRLYVIGFTNIQMRIKERAPAAWTTVLLRMAMMECAERLANMRKIKCLVTGESLSQVASQTVENISCTESRIKLPVFRPLIGMEKDEIIKTAVRIGTYDTSILPYEDCCVLFSPPHPVIRGDVAEANTLYEQLELGGLIQEAIAEAETEKCGFPEPL